MLAIMGPSGCGKTTLLNVLAQLEVLAATVKSTVLVDGRPLPSRDFRRISSYVEQEDALMGALTVRETLYFAAQLSLPRSVGKEERKHRIEALLSSFGLQRQAQVLVGTPIRKGISGGQKRRVSVASQLITSPKILFLDEPTSGLDSHASLEVMTFVKDIAAKHNLLVVTSIHQPSTSTFAVFDKLILLSGGRTMYNGQVSEVGEYFSQHGRPMPQYINPAEFILELVNTDFAVDQEQAEQRLSSLHDDWVRSENANVLRTKIEGSNLPTSAEHSDVIAGGDLDRGLSARVPFTLVHRSLIKSYRDVVAYGIRIAMYLGLAILMVRIFPLEAIEY
jgi:ABC-type multidrug transport system ATPase subunit